MKICHICPLYYPSLGGNQIHIQTISEALVQLGEDVSVLTSAAVGRSQLGEIDKSREKLQLREAMNGVDIRRFEISYLRHKVITQKLPRMRGGVRLIQSCIGDGFEYWKLGPCVKGMKKAIGQLKPEVILAVMENSFTTYIAYRASQKYNIPLVFMPITHVVDKEQAFQKFIQKIYDHASGIVACTEFEKHMLITRGVENSKIKVLPLGLSDNSSGNNINLDAVRLKYGIKVRPTVAYIGRLDYYKGVEALIAAMKIVWQIMPEAQLLIAGKVATPFQTTFNKLMNNLNAKEKSQTVEIGLFDEADKRALFAAVDVVVMASRVDCFGLVYLESWREKTPVIACSDTPQESIIDDGKNGFLVEYNNSNQLAERLQKVLNNQELKLSMGEDGYNKLKREYDLNEYASKMQKLYMEIVDEK